MKRKEFCLFLAYFLVFVLIGACFLVVFPSFVSLVLGENIVCTVAASSGLFCYNVAEGQSLLTGSIPINWTATVIVWVVDLTFLFGGAFLALKSYHTKFRKQGKNL